MNTALAELSAPPLESVPQAAAQLSRAQALAPLRALLLEELALRIDQAEGVCRTIAEGRAGSHTAGGRFEVDWELTEAVVGWSEEAIEEIGCALTRLEEGSYGWCEHCSKPISLQRLTAMPHARWCAPCQARRDATHHAH